MKNSETYNSIYIICKVFTTLDAAPNTVTCCDGALHLTKCSYGLNWWSWNPMSYVLTLKKLQFFIKNSCNTVPWGLLRGPVYHHQTSLKHMTEGFITIHERTVWIFCEYTHEFNGNVSNRQKKSSSKVTDSVDIQHTYCDEVIWVKWRGFMIRCVNRKGTFTKNRPQMQDKLLMFC